MKIAELHDRLFDFLCTLDDVCKENNVRYFLDSGTELGAVREKNFIPWDDDMDLKILAEDLDNFLAVMKEKLPEHYHIIEPDAFAPGFYDFVIRIYDDRWLLRDETEEDKFYCNLQNHVGTDVFLYAKVPDNALLRKILIIKIKMLYGMGMAHRYNIESEKYTFLQKMQIGVLKTMGKGISTERLYSIFKKIISKYNDKDCRYRIPVNFPLNTLKSYESAWFDDTILGEIRGRKFPIPKEYDAELTLTYGEYMKPPKNKDDYVHHLSAEDRQI